MVEIEEMVDLAEGIGVGAAHEAVADQADIERLLLLIGDIRRRSLPPAVGVANVDHGLEDIVPGLRLPHHAFGNMQPSQQMWWTACVGLPAASRSQ